MKRAVPKTAKESYKQMRILSCRQLWEQALRFEQLSTRDRLDQVGLIRAIGVVIAESGTAEDKQKAREWLLQLLKDPEEKIRRYAMAALPKIGAGTEEESALLGLLQKTPIGREKEFLGRALEKIGGETTLALVEENLPVALEQKIRANIARQQQPAIIRTDKRLNGGAQLPIHLHCRIGLETLLHEEVQELRGSKKSLFRVRETRRGLVVVESSLPFSLSDLYGFRCFATAGFLLGTVGRIPGEKGIGAIAGLVASERSRRTMEALTEGPLRYRLNFCDEHVSNATLRELATRIYESCPRLLNDSRSAPWSVDVFQNEDRFRVELRPRISPDPRLFYRKADIPAASHPPLAACMVRLGGLEANEVVWDPFCGSGLELIERCLKGGVRRAYGTDRSQVALEVAKINFQAAGVDVDAEFVGCDFRAFAEPGKGTRTGVEGGLKPGSVSLILTNPPLGKRVPIADLRGLIGDLLRVAAKVLKKGGRLVFANPLVMDSPDPTLKLQSRTVVDFGGFNCRLEKYVKQ